MMYLRLLGTIIFCAALAILVSIEYQNENSHSLPLLDTSMSDAVMGGRIPDDSFAAEVNTPIEPVCDSTVQQLRPDVLYSQTLDEMQIKVDSIKTILRRLNKEIKIPKSNGANAKQFNDRASPLLQKTCDTVFITTLKVRTIHDTIYLADPIPNQPTYIK